MSQFYFICLPFASAASQRHLGTPLLHLVPGVQQHGSGRRRGGFLATEFGAVPTRSYSLSFGDWFFCALNGGETDRPTDRRSRPTSWPSTVSICGTSIPQMKRKEGRREGRGDNPQWLSPAAVAAPPMHRQNPPESEKNGTKEFGARGR